MGRLIISGISKGWMDLKWKQARRSRVRASPAGGSAPPAPPALQSIRSCFWPPGNSALSLGFTTDCRGPGPELSVLPPREMQEILSGKDLREEENLSSILQQLIFLPPFPFLLMPSLGFSGL